MDKDRLDAGIFVCTYMYLLRVCQMASVRSSSPHTVHLTQRPAVLALIDTPGFGNEPDRDLQILPALATTLVDMSPRAGFGAMYPYDMEDFTRCWTVSGGIVGRGVRACLVGDGQSLAGQVEHKRAVMSWRYVGPPGPRSPAAPPRAI